MSQSGRARVGAVVLAIAVVAGVGVLVWRSQSDDTGKGGEQGARIQQEPERAPPPGLGGDDAAGEPTTAPAAGGSLHDRLGGREAIHVMTDKLLEAVQKDEVIMANEKVREAAKRVNVRELHQRLTNFVCKEAGGPCNYTGRPMKDYLAQLQLTSAEWDALTKDLAAILTEMKVPEQEAEELEALFGALQHNAVTAD